MIMDELTTAINKILDKPKRESDCYQNEEVSIIIKRICEEYGKAFGYTPLEIFEALESKRKTWHVNYYQDVNFPPLQNVVIFRDREHAKEIIDPKKGFRCPWCKGVSMHPYACNSGLKVELLNSEEGKKEVCNWKSFGLFGTMDRGYTFTVAKDWVKSPSIEDIFMPISIEAKSK